MARSNRRNRYRNPPRGVTPALLAVAAQGAAAAIGAGLGMRRGRTRTRQRGGSTAAQRNLSSSTRGRSISSNAMSVSPAARLRRRSRAPSRSRAVARRRANVPVTGISVFKAPTAGGLNIESRYTNRGFQVMSDQYGIVDDLDCVYLMHQPLTHLELVEVAFSAMLRELFRKGLNWDAKSADDIIPNIVRGTGGGEPVGLNMKVRITGGNPAVGGGDNVYTTLSSFTLLANSTITTIVAALRSVWINYGLAVALNNDANALEPFALILQQSAAYVDVGPVTNNYDYTMAIMYFEEMTCHYGGKSKLSIQNSTLSAAGLTEADTVDSNPLVGTIYQFSGLPKIRQDNMYLFQAMGNGTGVAVRTFGAAALPSAFKTPPPPKVFANSTKAGSIKLMPGEVKTSVLQVHKKAKFLKLIKMLRTSFSTAGPLTTYSLFPTQIIALKEIINTGAASLVSCRFENEYTYGAYITTKKAHRATLPKYSATAINEST